MIWFDAYQSGKPKQKNNFTHASWSYEKSNGWHTILVDFKHNLAHKQQVKHMKAFQVEHVNIIPLFHFFQFKCEGSTRLAASWVNK